jgi:hypothetical protein
VGAVTYAGEPRHPHTIRCTLEVDEKQYIFSLRIMMVQDTKEGDKEMARGTPGQSHTGASVYSMDSGSRSCSGMGPKDAAVNGPGIEGKVGLTAAEVSWDTSK